MACLYLFTKRTEYAILVCLVHKGWSTHSYIDLFPRLKESGRLPQSQL